MSSIILNHLSFEYENAYTKVFDAVSLTIDTRWKTGVIGRNGRGKTTLLKLIHGDLSPTKGSIDIVASTAFFPYSPDSPNQTTRQVIKDSIAPYTFWEKTIADLLENGDSKSLARAGDLTEQYEQAGGYEIDSQIEVETASMGLEPAFLEKKFTDLSGGEQTRALIIALFLRQDVFLLLDEPTNHLDMNGRKALAAYLARKEGFLLISHDRFFLDSCVDHILSINRSDIRLNQGNYSNWKYQFDLEKAREQRTNSKLKKEIHQLSSAAGKRRLGAAKKEKEKIGAYDKGHIGRLAAKQMKRGLVIEKRTQEKIEEKRELFKNFDKERNLKFSSVNDAPDILLNLQDVSIEINGNQIIKQFSLMVRKGQRLALVGPNGAGKTTLINAICGDIPIAGGVVHAPGNVSLSRSFQQPKWVTGDLRKSLQTEGVDETRFRQILGVMGVTGDVFEHPLETFSQGQLKKVDLCRTLISPATLLIWDEPVNYIDVISREQIEEAILIFEPNLLFIEHDRYFVDHVATDIVELKKP